MQGPRRQLPTLAEQQQGEKRVCVCFDFLYLRKTRKHEPQVLVGPQVITDTCVPLSTIPRGQFSQIFYEEAISVMRRRDCDASVALLEKAVSLAGAETRRGGEFKLWASQALQGVGRNKQAIEVLKSLKTHSDLDVRKV